MKRQTYQALATLTSNSIHWLDSNIQDAKDGIRYWLPKCKPDLKADAEVKDAYQNLNRLKNRLRMLRVQRTKWMKVHAEVKSTLKLTKAEKVKPKFTEP